MTPERATFDDGQVAQNRQAVSRLGTYIALDWPDMGEAVRFYALQPEQITTMRARLERTGLRGIQDIVQLNDLDGEVYIKQHWMLMHLLQICARDDSTDLLFPGDDGFARLEQRIDTARLIKFAVEICTFNQVWLTEVTHGSAEPRQPAATEKVS